MFVLYVYGFDLVACELFHISCNATKQNFDTALFYIYIDTKRVTKSFVKVNEWTVHCWINGHCS